MIQLRTIRNDQRGVLRELYSGSIGQCNLLVMKKGSVWGGHYHKKTTEFFYVIEGEIRVLLVSRNGTYRRNKIYQTGDSFIIKPPILHTIRVVKKTSCVVLYSRRFDPTNTDIYRKV